MPLGSSSAAPVTRPGPRLLRKPAGLSGGRIRLGPRRTLGVFVSGSASIVMSLVYRWHRVLDRSYGPYSKKTKTAKPLLPDGACAGTERSHVVATIQANNFFALQDMLRCNIEGS